MKLAVVTGASSGIDGATAVQLANAGYDVLACARRVDRLAAVQEAAGLVGGDAWPRLPRSTSTSPQSNST